ncbi:MAG: hypothetical protein COA72_10675 [Candidatus Neomarinimicrobiota bacterium]|nr:MAG: hypothetical protein COA72_10675 [Candidatus Neomarinimicrobiota bacterium]
MKIVAEASSLLVTAIRKINEGRKFISGEQQYYWVLIYYVILLYAFGQIFCKDYPTKKIRLFLIDNNIKEAVKFMHQLYSPIKI